MRLFLRVSLLLLGSSAAAVVASAQSTLPAGSVTPGSLTHFCAAEGNSGCVVLLDGHYTLTLTADWHLPSTVHLRFGPGSSLGVTGGVLHFDNASVEAPSDVSLFPDPDRVRGLSVARPEWFATAEEPAAKPVPASALAEAYEATVPWGTIYLQDRQYISPFHACPGSALRFNSPRTLVGSGRPIPDDPGAPTHLKGGTTLLGGIGGTAPLRLARLGIDVGPQVAAQVLHGCEPPGIFIEQPGRTFVSGDRLEDVSVLTTGFPNMHSVMFAGHRDVEIKGLWLWTLGGTHGLVMKSEDSTVDGFHCWGASDDCLIVKSDYATSFLGRAVHDRISHVDINPLRPGGSVGGIAVESRWDIVRDLKMNDIRQSGSRLAIVLLGSTFYRPYDIHIQNWKATNVTGLCLLADKVNGVTISGFECGLLPGAQAGALLVRSRNISFDRGDVRCILSATQCDAATTDGILNDATETSVTNVVMQDVSGYLIRNSHDPAKLKSVYAADRNGRVSAAFPISLSSRLRDSFLQTKPNLRILYTAVISRVLYRPRTFALLGLLLVLGGVFARVFPRPKRPEATHLHRV